MPKIDKTEEQGLTAVRNDAMISKLPPRDPEKREVKTLWRVIKVQVALILVCSLVVFGFKADLQLVVAVLCGGGVSLINSFMLIWRIRKSSAQQALDAHLQLRLLYFYAAERFLAVAVLLAACLLILKQSPLVLLGGFMMAQVAFVAARLVLSRFEITEDSE